MPPIKWNLFIFWKLGYNLCQTRLYITILTYNYKLLSLKEQFFKSLMITKLEHYYSWLGPN